MNRDLCSKPNGLKKYIDSVDILGNVNQKTIGIHEYGEKQARTNLINAYASEFVAGYRCELLKMIECQCQLYDDLESSNPRLKKSAEFAFVSSRFRNAGGKYNNWDIRKFLSVDNFDLLNDIKGVGLYDVQTIHAVYVAIRRGTIKINGCPYLSWTKLPIRNEDMFKYKTCINTVNRGELGTNLENDKRNYVGHSGGGGGDYGTGPPGETRVSCPNGGIPESAYPGPDRSFNEPRDTIIGWEPGASFTNKRHRHRLFGFGALSIDELKMQWFREIKLPEENPTDEADPTRAEAHPKYFSIPNVSHSNGVVGGVLSGNGNKIYFYNCAKEDGELIESIELDRDANPRFFQGNDLMLDQLGNLWWLEYPTSSFLANGVYPYNITQVVSLRKVNFEE